MVGLGFMLYKSYNSTEEEKKTIFVGGYYTNSVGTKISEADYYLLSLMTSKAEIDTMNSDAVTLGKNAYYAELEAYSVYGYVGSYEKTETKTGNTNEISVYKLVDKRLPFVSSELSYDTEEYFCALGTTKYGTWILAEYKDGSCAFEDNICDMLSEEGVTSYITTSTYCN